MKKTAIITGAASGIGQHWAGVLLAERETYNLALADINIEGLQAAFEPGESLRLHRLDIRSLDDWRHMIAETLERFGRIDYLFNIAGGGRPAFYLEQPDENIDAVIDLNLKGPLIGMKLVGEQMANQCSGHILHVGSLAGLSPTPGNALYSAAKGGLRNAALAAAVELRKRGVYVTVISPDLVDTPIMQRHLESAREEIALTYTGVTLTVTDLEKAFRRAMRDRPLEIDLPRWRGWLSRFNDLFPSIMFRLYEPMKKRGMRRFEKIRRERLGR